MDALAPFHPALRAWFAAEVGTPTAVQAQAWPAIADGGHVLAIAPTGTGKTLAAFLVALDRLLSGTWSTGALRVLYVSPLKALAADVRRNLLVPLAALARTPGLPALRAELRTGDTPPGERRRQLRRPPEILATTPESLALLLGSADGRAALADVRLVVLDEIHAVAGGKRGAWLLAHLERLVDLAGEFQRVALSATVRPPELVAAMVGGFAGDGRPRPVRVVAPPLAKTYELSVHGTPAPAPGEGGIWPALARELTRVVARNRSTLVFTTNRRHAERLARLMNEGEDTPLAWAHHGSLARELRQLVEERLKRGELKALVATSSLELGIDVGALDEVVLVQAPPSINSAVQRLGRAGHQVGAVSRGRLYATHGRDLLAAAALAPLAMRGQGEPVRPVRGPLDVLAQVVCATVAAGARAESALRATLARAWPFHDLGDAAWELVLAMLAGRWRDGRVRGLEPRLVRDDGRLEPLPGTALAVLNGGGTIPDRGYLAVKTAGGQKLGELDEEFVWERRPGDDIVVGAQAWRIAAIRHDTVEVVPSPRRGGLPPFWRADAEDRGGALSDAIAALLAEAETLAEPDLVVALQGRGLDADAAGRLASFLARQRAACGALPTAGRIVAERCPDPGGGDGSWLVLHAPWGGTLTRPWALALAAGWRRAYGRGLGVVSTDDAILLPVPETVTAREVIALCPPERLLALLREGLDETGFLGARFRQAAQRALLLPRSDARRRIPLWLTRDKAKHLRAAVGDDFPILAEAWRECLDDAFDLPALAARLAALHEGRIAVHECRTTEASPFSEGLAWMATNRLMYEDDAAPAAGAPLATRVLAQVARAADLRPAIAPDLAATLDRKLRRRHPGWTPRDRAECQAHLEALAVVAADDWTALVAAAAQESGVAADDLAAQLARVALPVGGAVVAKGERARLRAAATDDDALRALLAQHLRGRGPVPPGELATLLGLPSVRVDAALAALAEDGTVVVDHLLAGDDRVLACDTGNVERLLRAQRAAQRPAVEPIALAALPAFCARWHGLAPRAGGEAALRAALDRLVGWTAPAAQWEADLLPARVRDYVPALLDQLLATTPLRWHGAARERIGFALAGDLPLVAPGAGAEAETLLPHGGRFDLLALARRGGTAALADTLWRLCWRGEVANDGFAVVRQGLASGFHATPADELPGRGLRGLRAWEASRPLQGGWYALPRADDGDALDAAEADRERARRLLDRHGVVFRELLQHEAPAFAWGRLLPALRLLELGGEALTGAFVAGVPGLQFAHPAALATLAARTDDAPWWCAAQDPASCCGLGLDGLDLPPRLAGTRLVWHGARLALVVARGGRSLAIRLAADDPALPACLGVLRAWVQAGHPRVLAVERIDDVPATRSPWRELLLGAGFVPDYRTLVLRKAF